jgi:release factor glutamine methyltransferase
LNIMAELPQKLDAAVRSVAARLAKAGIEPAFTEARLIFELAGFDRMALLKEPDDVLSAKQAAIISDALDQRLAGKPVSRIRGWNLFDGRRFELSPDTLEPRDDTLTLVDAVTEFVRTIPSCRILDIGTGTGIIALTLLARVPHATALATDISTGALRVAQRNSEHLELANRFQTRQADMLDGISGSFDLVISNPPYISRAEIDTLEREVREHDPVVALDGGEDGLMFYRKIAASAGALMAQHGRVAVEIGYDQRESVAEIFIQKGFEELSFHSDLADRPRALVFRAR